MNEQPDVPCMNTDREIWREREGDYYADSIHVTNEGSIGIDCGGYVIVMPVRKWHALASAAVERATPEPAGGEAVAFYVIFDGPPEHRSGRFVEVETVDGKSVGKQQTGAEWKERDDALWSLGPFYGRLAPREQASAVRVPDGVFEGAGGQWKHLTRGTIYTVLGTAEVQGTLCEGDRAVIYRGNDGKPWARRDVEFLDGRFARIELSAAPPAPIVCTGVDRRPAAVKAENIAKVVSSAAPIDKPEEREANFVHTVPDRCDRIIWRNNYYSLPFAPPSQVETEANAEEALLRAFKVVKAPDESVKLQSHYASLLNQYDGGNRRGFADGNAWIARLEELASLSPKAKS